LVRGCSRSLKMTPFDRSHTTFYWPAIVNIALSCIVFELFDVEWYRDLEIWVIGHSRSLKLVPYESLCAVSYSPSIVTMAPSCINSDIKRDIGRKSWFFHTHLAFDAPVRGGPRQNIDVPFGKGKLEWWGYPLVKKLWGSIPACDRQTDGRTSCHGIVRAIHTRRAVKTN